MKRRKRTINYKPIITLEDGHCDCCGISFKRVIPTKHHILKTFVFKNYDSSQSVYAKRVCRRCHDIIEREITARENAILRTMADMYISAYYDVRESIRSKNDGRYKEDFIC